MITTPADARNLDKVLKLTGKNPEEIVLDVDWSSIKDEPRHARSREGGRGGERGARPGGRSSAPGEEVVKKSEAAIETVRLNNPG